MYKEELETVMLCSKEVLKIIKQHYHRKNKTSIKKNKDLVTEADIKIQDSISRLIKSKFPNDTIKGEEDLWTTNNAKRVWLIDPIDGTINFIEGNGEFSVCVAFLENDEPTVSMVLAPILRKQYHAIKGNGAYLNGKKISVSNKKGMEKSCLVLSRHLEGDNKDLVESFGSSIKYGSTALRVCLVAEGKAEAYLYNKTKDSKLNEWDICACDLILREAGGKFTDLLGKRFKYNNKYHLVKNGVIATNNNIHKKISQFVRK